MEKNSESEDLRLENSIFLYSNQGCKGDQCIELIRDYAYYIIYWVSLDYGAEIKLV